MSEQRLNEKLVGEVEKHPVLYNFHLPGYSKKDETEEAWSEVAKEVNMTVAECKGRWKNLRAVFVRHMKPLKAGGAKLKKAYYLLEAMQFTIPFIKALSPFSGNLLNHTDEEVSEQYEDIDFEPSLKCETHLQSEPSSTSQELPTLTTDAYAIRENITQTQLQPSAGPIPDKKRALKDTLDEAYIDHFHVKKARTMSSACHPDLDSKSEALKMFLLSMLPDLLSMSDVEVRLFKRNSLQVIDDILSARTKITSPQIT